MRYDANGGAFTVDGEAARPRPVVTGERKRRPLSARARAQARARRKRLARRPPNAVSSVA